jgi:hypothetical protein
MKKELLLAVAFATSVLAGCAASQEGNNLPVVEKQYRTGSNLAVRHSSAADGVTTVSKEDLDRARESSMDAGRSMPTPRPGGR